MGLHTKLIFFNTHRHISEVYAQLAEACQAKVDNIKMDRISILSQDKNEFESWSRLNINGKKYLVVNPNSSDLMLERRWPAGHFISLINRFADFAPDGMLVVLMGSTPESEYVSGLYEQLSDKAKKITLNAAGQLSLGAVFSLIDSAVLMITSDTGPYHFASSFSTPTISLWGPTSPSHYSLKESHDFIIYKNIYCSPCLYHADNTPCMGDNICVKMIRPFEVLTLVLEFLGIDVPIETSDR
jgi:ADP-heptose:LPS heptosyltransferase